MENKNISNNIEKKAEEKIKENIEENIINKDYKNATSLYNRLVAYSETEVYPFHMPGHKRNSKILNMANPYDIDITEIDDFDNLHNANDIILNLMEKISKYYETKKSFVLVNGSSCGILAAISAATVYNKNILVGRNCHKSVYNAILVNRLNATYVYPKYNKNIETFEDIEAEEIERSLYESRESGHKIGTIVITSPTYEGVVSDIDKISEIAKKYDCTLIVDEAHGAHFSGSDYFPKSSIKRGADIVIHSVHKTLPSLTQTALLHICNDRVNEKVIEKYLSVYESSSPSYVLMASVDRCFSLLNKCGKELFLKYTKRLDNLLISLKELKNIEIYNGCEFNKREKDISVFDRCKVDGRKFDRSKIVIYGKKHRLSGKKLYDILLNKYKLQMEMASTYYVIGMTSICDTDEGFRRLISALKEIDEDSKTMEYLSSDLGENNEINLIPKKKYSMFEAEEMEKITIDIKDATGKVAGDAVYLYPPGSPIIVAGEIYSQEIIYKIIFSIESGLNVLGTKGKNVIIVSEKVN